MSRPSARPGRGKPRPAVCRQLQRCLAGVCTNSMHGPPKHTSSLPSPEKNKRHLPACLPTPKWCNCAQEKSVDLCTRQLHLALRTSHFALRNASPAPPASASASASASTSASVCPPRHSSLDLATILRSFFFRSTSQPLSHSAIQICSSHRCRSQRYLHGQAPVLLSVPSPVHPPVIFLHPKVPGVARPS